MTELPPVHQVAAGEDGDSGEVLHRRGDEVEVVANTADAGVGVKAGQNGIAKAHRIANLPNGARRQAEPRLTAGSGPSAGCENLSQFGGSELLKGRMRSRSRGVAVILAIAWGCGVVLAGCAYGGEADPGGAKIAAKGDGGSSGGAGSGVASSGGSSPTTGSAGSEPGSAGDFTVGTGGAGGSGVVPDEAGAVEDAMPVVVNPMEASVVDAGPRDTGVRDAVVDVAKPTAPSSIPTSSISSSPRTAVPASRWTSIKNSQTNGVRVKQ